MVPNRRGRRTASVIAVLLAFAAISALWLDRDNLRRQYALWREFESVGMNPQGYSEYRHRQTGIIFVSLPGGSFSMGSPEGETATRGDHEGPVHDVTLTTFLIAKYEVSQGEWRSVMGEDNNPSTFRGDDLPVDTVAWEQCEEFCRRTRLRLPSEAQWEYACRAGTTTRFAFGDSITTEQVNYNGWAHFEGYDLSAHAEAAGEDRRKTVPVDRFEPNRFGLYQMHGNVRELCEDDFDAYFYHRSEATRKDPVCRGTGAMRVYRGGGWDDGYTKCRSAWRNGFHSWDGLGFRPAWRWP